MEILFQVMFGNDADLFETLKSSQPSSPPLKHDAVTSYIRSPCLYASDYGINLTFCRFCASSSEDPTITPAGGGFDLRDGNAKNEFAFLKSPKLLSRRNEVSADFCSQHQTALALESVQVMAESVV